MKTESLQQLAKDGNMTLSRAAEEVICAAGARNRSYPAIIRRQKIPVNLLAEAKSYEKRKTIQLNASADQN